MKTLTGTFYTIVRTKDGNYSLVIAEIDKGKVIASKTDDSNFPSIVIAKLTRQLLLTAQKQYESDAKAAE